MLAHDQKQYLDAKLRNAKNVMKNIEIRDAKNLKPDKTTHLTNLKGKNSLETDNFQAKMVENAKARLYSIKKNMERENIPDPNIPQVLQLQGYTPSNQELLQDPIYLNKKGSEIALSLLKDKHEFVRFEKIGKLKLPDLYRKLVVFEGKIRKNFEGVSILTANALIDNIDATTDYSSLTKLASAPTTIVGGKVKIDSEKMENKLDELIQLNDILVSESVNSTTKNKLEDINNKLEAMLATIASISEAKILTDNTLPDIDTINNLTKEIINLPRNASDAIVENVVDKITETLETVNQESLTELLIINGKLDEMNDNMEEGFQQTNENINDVYNATNDVFDAVDHVNNNVNDVYDLVNDNTKSLREDYNAMIEYLQTLNFSPMFDSVIEKLAIIEEIVNNSTDQEMIDEGLDPIEIKDITDAITQTDDNDIDGVLEVANQVLPSVENLQKIAEKKTSRVVVPNNNTIKTNDITNHRINTIAQNYLPLPPNEALQKFRTDVLSFISFLRENYDNLSDGDQFTLNVYKFIRKCMGYSSQSSIKKIQTIYVNMTNQQFINDMDSIGLNIDPNNIGMVPRIEDLFDQSGTPIATPTKDPSLNRS